MSLQYRTWMVVKRKNFEDDAIEFRRSSLSFALHALLNTERFRCWSSRFNLRIGNWSAELRAIKNPRISAAILLTDASRNNHEESPSTRNAVEIKSYVISTTSTFIRSFPSRRSLIQLRSAWIKNTSFIYYWWSRISHCRSFSQSLHLFLPLLPSCKELRQLCTDFTVSLFFESWKSYLRLT